MEKQSAVLLFARGWPATTGDETPARYETREEDKESSSSAVPGAAQESPRFPKETASARRYLRAMGKVLDHRGIRLQVSFHRER
jgi:hypothetical protein